MPATGRKRTSAKLGPVHMEVRAGTTLALRQQLLPSCALIPVAELDRVGNLEP